MADIILQNYYIKIGYKVDEQQQLKMKEGLADLGKRIKEVGAAAVAAAGTAALAFLKIAQSINQLDFNAKRLDSTPEQIEGIARAFTAVGESADSAYRVIGKLASQMRSAPGFGEWVKGLTGVELSQDKMQNFFNIIRALKERSALGPAQAGIAAQIAEKALGIDEETLHLFEQNIDEMERKYHAQEKASAVDKKAADQMHELIEKINDLKQSFQNFTEMLAIKFLPVMQKILDVLIAWDKATGGLSTFLAVLGTAAAGAITTLGALAAGFGGVAGAAGAAASAIGVLLALLGGFGIGAGAGYLLDKHGINIVTWWRKNFGDLRESGKSGLKGPVHSERFRSRGAADIHGLVRDVAVQMGVDPNLAAAVAHTESNFRQVWGPKIAGTSERAFGVMQLMPGTAKAMGVDREDTLGNIIGGVAYLKGLIAKYGETGALAHYGGFVHTDPTKYIQGVEKYKLGEQAGHSITNNVKTDIHVNGANDPKIVADRVLQGQDDVNADLVRYAQSRMW